VLTPPLRATLCFRERLPTEALALSNTLTDTDPEHDVTVGVKQAVSAFHCHIVTYARACCCGYNEAVVKCRHIDSAVK
jgi:hypothetical protein